MRLQGFHSTQHLAAIRGFADDLNVVLLHQERAEPLPQEGMRISDEYGDRVHTAKIPPSLPKDEHSLLVCRDTSVQINASVIVPVFRTSCILPFVLRPWRLVPWCASSQLLRHLQKQEPCPIIASMRRGNDSLHEL
jgi:hypothetical protein